MSSAPDTPPRWVWMLAISGVALVILVIIGAALLIAAGVTDPLRAGPEVWSDDTLRWASGPEILLAAGESVWLTAAPMEAALPGDPFTLDVRARLTPDSGAGAAWGVWIETTDASAGSEDSPLGIGQARVIYAINGEGYTTTRRCELPLTPWPPLPPSRRGGIAGTYRNTPLQNTPFIEIEDCPALRPEWRWFAYPRIYPPGETNQITLHVEQSGEIRLRLNHEIMGIAPLAWSGRWGVWARGGRETAAVLILERAAIYGQGDLR